MGYYGGVLMEILNKRARFDYFIEDEIEAGIALTGTEIKSIRNGNCNIKDCYGVVKNGEIFLLNMYIGEYKEGNIFNHQETRSRKLLLHKKEIKKITEQMELNGLTLVPLKGYFKDNHFKILLGICRGKKTYDKRETIKNRDIQREVQSNLKRYK
jgi:SsrA-binding protein